MKNIKKKMTVRDLMRELNMVPKGCADYDLILRAPGNLACCVIKSNINGACCTDQEEGFVAIDKVCRSLHKDKSESRIIGAET